MPAIPLVQPSLFAMKVCSKCGQEWPLDRFMPKNAKCRDCRTAAAREWRHANPEKSRMSDRRRYAKRMETPTYQEWRREYHRTYRKNPTGKMEMRRTRLQREYGLTLADYDRMVIAQEGQCAICGEIPNGSFHVDHSHRTGTVRALLCSMCNQGLGSFRDDPVKLRAAITYLERHGI